MRLDRQRGQLRMDGSIDHLRQAMDTFHAPSFKLLTSNPPKQTNSLPVRSVWDTNNSPSFLNPS